LVSIAIIAVIVLVIYQQQNKEAEDEASPVNSSDRLWRLHAEEHRTKEAEV
jgi:hypothetical protein